MGHPRWSDIIILFIAGFVALGVYGLLLLIGQPTLGTIFAIVTLCGFCSFEHWLFNTIKNRKKKLPRYKSIKQQKQEVISTEVKEVNSYSLYNNKFIENFKYCTKCGSRVKIENKFCYNCGNQFVD